MAHDGVATRLTRRTLAHQVADDLVRKIVRRHIARGESLPSEQALAEEYTVSRPVVREALRALEGQGYVVMQRGRGAVVAEPHARILENFFTWVLHGDATGWTDLMAVRRVLEIESVRAAARNRDESDLCKLKQILGRMATEWEDATEYSSLDVQFHIAIAYAARNDFLVYLIESIRGSLVELLSHLRVHLPLDLRPAIQSKHEEIYVAILQRDEQCAADAMALHFDDVVERLGRVPPLAE
jgi:GntR family transcriptional regulator, transcriptional repressor for pyruvate dehydrogenase complex